MLRTYTVVTLALSSVLVAGCGRDQAGDTADQSVPSQSGERQTATGCLSMNPESRLYVLTTAPDPMVGTTGGVIAQPPTTITYQLAGGQGLENHIGHEIEVTGWVDQDAAQSEGTTMETKEAPRNIPEGDAKVETTTEAHIRVVPMEVESFRLVSTECTSGDTENEETRRER